MDGRKDGCWRQARAPGNRFPRRLRARPRVSAPPPPLSLSGVNVTAAPRRGFSANYVDARTRVLEPKPALAGPIGVPGHTFPLVWPSPFEVPTHA